MKNMAAICLQTLRSMAAPALLLATLALSACGGPLAAPRTPQPTDTAEPLPTQAIVTATATATPQPPEATMLPTENAANPFTAFRASSEPSEGPATPPPTSAPPTLEPGFTTAFAPLPEGFPILPDAEFVAYNPAYDPCLSGERDCAPGRALFEVWLYELPLPAHLMGPAAPHVLVASRYADLLEEAGYTVQSRTEHGVTSLAVIGSEATAAAYAEVLVGPPVSDHKPPPDQQLVGLRLSIEKR